MAPGSSAGPGPRSGTGAGARGRGQSPGPRGIPGPGPGRGPGRGPGAGPRCGPRGTGRYHEREQFRWTMAKLKDTIESDTFRYRSFILRLYSITRHQ